MSNADNFLIRPTEGLKRGYGLPKLHKPGIPVRPIVSSLNSITSGAESFLKKLIRPILEECIFSCKSTREFKEKFLNDRNEFNQETHQIVS